MGSQLASDEKCTLDMYMYMYMCVCVGNTTFAGMICSLTLTLPCIDLVHVLAGFVYCEHYL